MPSLVLQIHSHIVFGPIVCEAWFWANSSPVVPWVSNPGLMQFWLIFHMWQHLVVVKHVPNYQIQLGSHASICITTKFMIIFTILMRNSWGFSVMLPSKPKVPATPFCRALGGSDCMHEMIMWHAWRHGCMN